MNLADANRTILFLVGIALLLLSGRVEATTIIKINRTKKTVRILLDAAEVSSFKKGDSVSISVGKRTYVGSVSWEGADKALIFIPAGLKGFPEDGTEELTGINFLSLLKYEPFYIYYSKIKQSNLKFYTKYFNEYMFKGKNLYEYWATENNPLFLISFGISEGLKLTENKEEELNDTLV